MKFPDAAALPLPRHSPSAVAFFSLETILAGEAFESMQGELDRRISEKLRRELGREVCALLEDDTVIEITLNPDGRLWVDRLDSAKETFGSMPPHQAESLITTLASVWKMTVTRENPRLSCELPLDGSRFQGSLPPIVRGPAFAIRKRARRVFTLEDYVKDGILTVRQREIIERSVDRRLNILVVGGTKSGKTTFANAIIDYMSKAHPDHRLAILEDTIEIQCNSPNVIQMRTSDTVPMEMLLKDCLRYSPDRILVGEVREPHPAMTLIDSWNTGHEGGVATTHANAVTNVNNSVAGLLRIESLIRRVVEGQVPVKEIAAAVNIVVYMAMTREGRRVQEIVSVQGHDGTNYITTKED